MNIYFACSSRKIRDYKDYYLSIIDRICRSRHKLVVNWISNALNRPVGRSIDQNESERLYLEGIRHINNSDILIADISVESSSVGYQISHAMSAKKPTLCIYCKEIATGKMPQVISANHSSYLTIKIIETKGQVNEVIKNFLSRRENNYLKKFNFLVDNDIDKYLINGARRYNLSKSEFLRNQIKEYLLDKT